MALTWTRVSAGHYDSDDGSFRIDRCEQNRSRFDLYERTERREFSDDESWEQVACRETLREVQEYAEAVAARFAVYRRAGDVVMIAAARDFGDLFRLSGGDAQVPALVR